MFEQPGGIVRRYALPAAKSGAVLVGIVWLTAWSWREAGAYLLEGAALWVVGGVLLSQLSLFLFALRLRSSLAALRMRCRSVDVFKVHSLAMFYHFFVPFSLGADLTKFFKLQGLLRERRARDIAAAIALDHIVGLLALMLLAALLSAFMPSFVLAEQLRPVAVGLLGCAAIAIGLLLWRMWRAVNDEGLVTPHHRGHVRVVQAAALSFAMHLLLALAVYVAAIALGVGASYSQITLVLTLSFVFQSIPASLVGLGAADVAATGLYVLTGLSLADALLLVSALYAYRVIAALIGGAWEITASIEDAKLA